MFALFRTVVAEGRIARVLPLMLAAAVIFTAGAGTTARAQDSGEDEVVARVNGQEIRFSDVDAAMADLPPQYANMPREMLMKGIVEELINRELAVQQARKLELQDQEEVKRIMENLQERVLEQAFYRRAVERKVTEETLRRRYEQDKESLVTDKKVHARHILVKTREEAVQLIADIRGGADFARLASEKSIGPSKAKGGDLGFFTRDQMVAPFSNAAFNLGKGEVSQAPVQTQYGWHVIKVEDIQEAAPPDFEDVREELRGKIADEVIDAELEDLRKNAKIERVDAGTAPAPMPQSPMDAMPPARKQ